MRRPTILIADDDHALRAALRVRLKSFGYSVVESADCLSVLNHCPAGWVDAIILDHEMPYGDGQSTARVLRKHTDAPIIFLSGQQAEQFAQIVQEFKDIYYLPKPLDDEKLRTLLESVVRPASPLAAAGAPVAG